MRKYQWSGGMVCLAVAVLLAPLCARAADVDPGIGQAPGTCTVLTPNGGEVWNGGETHRISWNATGMGDTVRIYLYDGKTKIRPSIAVELPETGFYDWALPVGIATGQAYRIRVTSMHLPQTDKTQDYSDTYFAIGSGLPVVNVTSPVPSDNWLPGTSHDITWTSAFMGGQVRIYLYDQWSKVRSLGTADANAGTWTWAIPAGEAQGQTFRIRVTSMTLPSPPVQDYSDGYFSMLSDTPAVAVTAPNGGEFWQRGTPQIITWDQTALSGKVRIYLYLGWTKVRALAEVNSWDETWTWNIPAGETPQTGLRIRVVSIAVPGVQDFSDLPFTITP